VHVDADRITQVLTNLLGNALLATPAGGRVTVSARRVGERAEAVVTDTGVGLAAEDLERVFERFYRAPGPTRRSAGSGIGLTIARGIARAHGGDVTAWSAGRGRGAAFTLALPIGGGRTR
jgi:histidine kinase